ncbi:MAG: ABC transporter permease [Bacteroidota bacterium]
MFFNHLKIAFRQLWKQKLYTFINVMGLAVGVACCLLIALHLKDELSYDRFHEQADRLYRVAFDIKLDDDVSMGTCTPSAMANALSNDFPEIEKTARLNPYFFNAGDNYVRSQDATQSSFEEKFTYADPSFFELFDLPLVQGTSNLEEPFKVVITQKVADKFFAGKEAVGEVLVLDDNPETSYEVMGVIENIPENSHFNFDYFMSMSTLENSTENDWVMNAYFTYALLSPNADPKVLEQKFMDFAKQYIGPQFKSRLNIDYENLLTSGERYNIALQPLKDIYLYSQSYDPHLGKTGDIRYVWLFGAVALFILFIAMVNFVNLATARSANRAKEVGVRKVIGSQQKQLIGQFLSESLVVSFIAVFLGLLIALIALPSFNQFIDKSLRFPFLSPFFLLSILGLAALVGLLAGLYPSFYLSAFQPMKVLKGELSRGSKSAWLRSGLVVFQFAISVTLIAATLVVGQQMNYIQNRKLGFEKDQILLVNDAFTLNDRFGTFQEELKRMPEVKNHTASGFLPLAEGLRNSFVLYAEGKDPNKQIASQLWRADENYLNTLGIQLKQGRNFKPNMSSDSNAVIINETLLAKLGIEGDPIGKRVVFPDGFSPKPIIGVMEDFHFESLHDEIGGLCLVFGTDQNTIAIKTEANQMENLISKVEILWKNTLPGTPFRYDFLDERFAEMYKGEQNMGTTFSTFAMLAILIACLGLFALAVFMIEQRKKEIGVRKVLGASISNIVLQLNKNFAILVLVASVIAIPLSWYLMNLWLQDFSYRMDMPWWIFALAGLVALGIAFLTVSFQSIRAALANPIESLRNE